CWRRLRDVRSSHFLKRGREGGEINLRRLIRHPLGKVGEQFDHAGDPAAGNCSLRPRARWGWRPPPVHWGGFLKLGCNISGLQLSAPAPVPPRDQRPRRPETQNPIDSSTTIAALRVWGASGVVVMRPFGSSPFSTANDI